MGVGVMLTAGVVALAYGAGQWRTGRPVERGAELLARGDYSTAVRTLLPAVAAAPRNARAHYYLGLAYDRVGLRQGAINQLADAVRLDPGQAQFHLDLGRAYRRAGDAERAVAELEEACRLGPAAARPHVEIAGVLIDQGRLDEAIARLRTAVRLRPRAPEIHLLLATALRRAGDGAGMAEHYREVSRLADGTALGETARLELRLAGLQGR